MRVVPIVPVARPMVARALLAGALVAAGAACAAARSRPAAPPHGGILVYACADGTRWSLHPVPPDPAPGGLALRLVGTAAHPADRELRLTPDTAGGTRAAGRSVGRSVGRDTAGAVTLRQQGDVATLAGDALPARTCRAQRAATPWDEARLLGADYRAVGQEPGWWVEVDEGRRIQFVGDYGSTRVALPTPPAATESAAGGVNRTTWRARGAARALVVDVVRQPCRDAMSGEPSPTTAVVQLDGREYRGCGRWLNPPAAR